METVVKFLTDAKTFYLATADGDQPRVRPMGFVMSYKGRLYMGTNNTKDMYRQMQGNPRIEICAFGPDGRWIRACGKVSFDDSAETQAKALEAAPQLKSMYSVGDGKFTLFYFEPGAVATISGFDGNKKEIRL
ncbi:MAG: pyridoxamine 5'-phosphate oxidase family protein [Spirochaetaceae bacterium]|jgi:uncharacterized pyridoxamine 5'-phosphate oxidase family protein|nr:pyridoxamine 5'-phosphate oxidase family protein [Spirochaetaceae bacterium]